MIQPTLLCRFLNAERPTCAACRCVRVIDDVLSKETVAKLNAEFDSRVAAEVPPEALGWYLKTHSDGTGDAPAVPRRVWAAETICPPKVDAVLREIFSDPWWGLLPTDRKLPKSELGQYRLDHDNAHWLAPFDPQHGPSDPTVDFPTHLADPALHEYPQSGGTWSEQGVLRGGFVRLQCHHRASTGVSIFSDIAVPFCWNTSMQEPRCFMFQCCTN